MLSLFLGSPDLHQAFYMRQESIYAGLPFFGLLYTPIELVLSVVMQMFSRKNEYEADRFAAETIDEPRSLITALKRLPATNPIKSNTASFLRFPELLSSTSPAAGTGNTRYKALE